MSSYSSEQKLTVGIILVVVAAGIVLLSRSKDHDAGIACGLTSAAMPLITDGLTHGRNSSAILASTTAAGVLLNTECVDAVKTWADTSGTATVVAGDTSQSVSGADLAQPVQAGTLERTLRGIQCRGWTAQFLYDACVAGTLAPPPS